jgi:predicted MPP superfamily phosphohydrolase
VSGMYHVDGQDVHVSTGLGTTGFGIRHVAVYVRFLCRAEVVLFRFVPAP